MVGSLPNTSFLLAIRSRMAEIRVQRQALDSEYGELETAERVAQRLEPILAVKTETDTTGAKSKGSERPANGTAPKRQTDYIKAVLKSSENPWCASFQVLHDEIKRIYDVDIPNNSLHPLLSKLKSEGVIVRNGLALALKERVEGHRQPEVFDRKAAAE